MRSSYAIFALLCLFLLTGCDVDVSQALSVAICHGLIGPILYNTYDPKSGRYAAQTLALDLKARNQIGQALHCAQYR